MAALESADGLWELPAAEEAPMPAADEVLTLSEDRDVSVEDRDSLEIWVWTGGGGWGAAPLVPDFFLRRPNSFLGRVPNHG